MGLQVEDKSSADKRAPDDAFLRSKSVPLLAARAQSLTLCNFVSALRCCVYVAIFGMFLYPCIAAAASAENVDVYFVCKTTWRLSSIKTSAVRVVDHFIVSAPDVPEARVDE